MNVADGVLERYSKGANQTESALCCPVEYDQTLLKMLPGEILEKDYGCGDPSKYVEPGDTVLDLGSGGGKICYMAAQLVGDQGRVIGVDINDDMLALARKYQKEMSEKLGSDRVVFHKAYIQDLALDMSAIDDFLSNHPVQSSADLHALHAFENRLRKQSPLIADNTVDLVISNCVLNLVNDEQKATLVKEIFRVLKPGGRVAISDIVSDEAIPQQLKANKELWSGCISGAFEESQFVQSFIDAGFVAVRLDKWDIEPWQVVENIEFRSATLTAVKAEGAPCMDRGHAVIYRGPYESVNDDEGHIYERGQRMAVCERTYHLLTQGPYKGDFIGITPSKLKEPVAWCATSGTRRPAKETKGGLHDGNKGGGCC